MLDFSTIVTAVNLWLIGSYRIGEFIVCAGISLIEMSVDAIRSFNSVSVLLYEGSTLWVQDILEYLCAINELIHNSYEYTLQICYSVSSIVVKAVYTPFLIIATILTSIRELLLLLGSSCLFLLSLPPLFLFYFIETLPHAFNTFGSFAHYTAKRISEHAADIKTLEALLGLVAGCGLIVIGVNGIKFLAKSYYKFKNGAARALKTMWRKAKKSITSVQRSRQERNTSFKARESELCAVCFDNARSVCFLPCRHLCLCLACTELLAPPLRCPLCRRRAEDLLHVYL